MALPVPHASTRKRPDLYAGTPPPANPRPLERLDECGLGQRSRWKEDQIAFNPPTAALVNIAVSRAAHVGAI